MDTANNNNIFVLHQVVDKEAWGNKFGEIFDVVSDKQPDEAYAHPMFGGHRLKMTLGSEDNEFACCIWQCKPGTTLDTFQTFIDDFTGPTAAKNTPSWIDMNTSAGVVNLDEHMYIKDLQMIPKEKKTVVPYAGPGDLWFVRHNLVDKAAWDAWFGQTMVNTSQASNLEDLKVAWKIRAGYACVLTLNLAGSSDGAVCVWDTPKGASKEDFQDMIDSFTTGSQNTPVWKVNKATAVNSRVLHPDFYAQDIFAFIKASMTTDAKQES